MTGVLFSPLKQNIIERTTKCLKNDIIELGVGGNDPRIEKWVQYPASRPFLNEPS